MPTRIPPTDAEFNTFTITATIRLGAASEGGAAEVIESAIPEATTHNLAQGPFSNAIQVKLENTGAASTLTFCRAGNATVGCAPPNIIVAPGASVIIAMGDIPGTGNFLNVTNQFGLGAGSYRVTLPTASFVRLGIPGDVYVSWVNWDNRWAAKYAQYANEDTRTTTITHEKNNLKEDFTAFMQPVLNIIAASPNITEGDRTVFHIKKRDANPTPRETITTAPFVLPFALQGGGNEI